MDVVNRKIVLTRTKRGSIEAWRGHLVLECTCCGEHLHKHRVSRAGWIVVKEPLQQHTVGLWCRELKHKCKWKNDQLQELYW